MLAAYERAMVREVAKIMRAIPPEDLAIQWDVCNEVMDTEGVYPWLPHEGAWQRRASLGRRGSSGSKTKGVAQSKPQSSASSPSACSRERPGIR